MPLILVDILERMKQFDEVELLEYLNITSEDLVDRFTDIIEENLEKFKELVEW
jgi:hypothetical protein